MKCRTFEKFFNRLTNARRTISILTIGSLILLSPIAARPQNELSTKTIYAAAKDSVFLVYLNDSSGSPTALGTAFVIAPHLLATNAHVVNAGTPVLAVGPVRLPLKVVHVDEKNDLAVMAVGIDLVSKPLPLASLAPSPGDQIFAIGNPEGLENTISQGIVSGVRTANNRDLIQITSPISHGSSGGPVLNSKGEVVGVAVGMLENGQNLNFAVPVKYVRALLDQKGADVATAATDCMALSSHLNDLFVQWQQDEYSDEASSPYQRHTQDVLQAETDIVHSCGQPSVLQQVACFGTKTYFFSDMGIAAARKLLDLKPSPDSRALLAYVLFDRAQDEDVRSAFFAKDEDSKQKAAAAHKSFITQAGQTASSLTKLERGNSFLVASYVLGGVKEDAKDFSSAMALHALDANAAPTICGNDLALAAYRELISEAAGADHADQAEMWFRQYAAKYQPASYEWDAEGDRLELAKNRSGAADAYERAAATDKDYKYDYCYASTDRYFQEPTDSDAVLRDGRQCIDGSLTEGRGFAKKNYENKLPHVYDAMAQVLEARGVHEQAYEYIKSSLATSPDDAFALFHESVILQSLERYTECISAAQAAIRVSDGKYPFMQEQLGECYFHTEDWTRAAASFRIAAEADSTDATSAFNLGLSLMRQGYTADAREWFRSALRRNPSPGLREKIQVELQ